MGIVVGASVGLLLGAIVDGFIRSATRRKGSRE